ncbi:MAG: hypothetical protein ACE5EY_06315, partial [Anaerolineae bacterium]
FAKHMAIHPGHLAHSGRDSAETKSYVLSKSIPRRPAPTIATQFLKELQKDLPFSFDKRLILWENKSGYFSMTWEQILANKEQ